MGENLCVSKVIESGWANGDIPSLNPSIVRSLFVRVVQRLWKLTRPNMVDACERSSEPGIRNGAFPG